MKQKHGNTGNRHAAKPPTEKLAERLNLTVRRGTKARIKVASKGRMSPWLRAVIEEKLNQEEK